VVQLLRRLALPVLWALAAMGVGCGVVWGATAIGLIQPLVVISGSMEPEIMTGDLLIATKVPAESLEVGDVVSLPSALTDSLVTHRITAIADSDGTRTVTMKGDHNEFSDALDYPVTGDVWKPAVQLPGWGTAIMRMTTPAVAVPLFLGLLGLLGLSMMSPAERPARQPLAT
jgi:signal peptidase I